MDTIFTVFVMIAALIAFVWFCVLFPAELAEQRNRSQVGWVIVAILGTPLLAVILLLILGEKKVAE